MITNNISLMMFVLLLVHGRVTDGQTFSFSQPATGPSSVCEGSDVTLQCVIIQTNPNNMTVVTTTIWSRNGMPVQVNNGSGNFFIPNHSTVFNSTTGAITDLVITDVTLEDDNTVYTCTSASASMTSSLVLNVTGIPPVENLMVADQCTTIRASWDITEGSCKDLSYDVTLLSSDGVILQGPFTTSDTVYNFTNVKTFNGNFIVSVAPFDVNVIEASATSAAVIDVSPDDLPTVTNIRNISRICVTYFNISWDAPNSITCGDVYYEVSISPPPIERDAVVTTVDSFLSVTGLNNSLPDVTITVTAINRAGRGDGRMYSVPLPKSLDPPYTAAYNVTISSSLTPADLSGFDIVISWTDPPIADPCTTLPAAGYYIHAIVTNSNGDARIYTSNRIDGGMGDSMCRFNVSYNDSFDQELEPNATYAFVVNTQNNIIEIPRTSTSPSCDDESNDELPTGVAIAITFVATFVITLVVTALISIIITSMYYKHKSVISQDGDSHVLTEDNKRDDPAFGTTTKTNITMDTNPAYGTATAIKMDTNPAYATTS